MHTIFINTTKNKIGNRIDALKYEREFKKLVYVDCPLATWNDSENGYKKVVKTVSEIIDRYNDVNSDFNLIIYTDLVEISEYRQLDLLSSDIVVQESVNDAYNNMVMRFFVTTILHELGEYGRLPAEKMLLLIERPETKRADYGKERHGDTLSKYERAERDSVLKLLRVLPFCELEKKLKSLKESGDHNVENILDKDNANAPISFTGLYADRLQLLIESVITDGVPIERACSDLCDAVRARSKSDSNNSVNISELYANKRILSVNMEARIKHDFLLQCFILDCIRSNTLYEKNEGVPVAKRVPTLSNEQWDEILKLLDKKKKSYEREEAEIKRLGASYSKLGLAPDLISFANEKFGLDKSGSIDSKLVIHNLPKEEKGNKRKKKKKEENEGSPSSTSSLQVKTAELMEKRGVIQNWFEEEEYRKYDCDGDEFVSKAEGLLSADEYCEKATELANHHLNIINKLNIHVNKVLSNYASRSMTNDPAILRKRSVNTGEDVSESAKKDYKYAKASGTGFSEETEPLESVLKTSKRSYVTIMLEYLKFEAGRGIAMTSIKDQCEWFINRIRQIERSLKKLLWIFVVLSIVVGVLYVPFLLVQWEAIIEDVHTVIYALGALAVPFVLLFICYTIARAVQKRKMKKAWDELLDFSREVTAENKRAITAFDELLTKYIPSLRWTYEYVLDVDFHRDCCKIARTKLSHHNEKLLELKELIGGLLDDLDYSSAVSLLVDDYEIDYTKAFCEGDNTDFYSVIDKQLLDTIYGRGAL